jgi:hypothetical protein
MQHPSGIPEKIVRKVVGRSGRLHAFDAIEPKTTPLVVIDLDEATVELDDLGARFAGLVETAFACRQLANWYVGAADLDEARAKRERSLAGCAGRFP